VNRRNLLAAATSLVGAFAAFFAATPFIRSLLPSAKARALAEPIEIDLSALAPGQVKAYEYRGRVILVLRRSPEMMSALADMQDRLLDASVNADPLYVASEHRSIQPEFLIVEGVCTHLACVPLLTGVADGQRKLGGWWRGGFICPCHVSAFDYAGRVVKGPAPRNLPIPPHRYVSPTRVVIGEAAALT
jgi:ubiquinol-cytochrome c reductase iron-sulfur subunit